MKLLINIILTIILAYILSMFLPWWSVAIAAFVVAALLNIKNGASFLGGFLGVFLLQSILAYLANSANNDILASKVAGLFSLPNSMSLILLTGVVGGLVGGFAALTGSLGRKLGRS